MTDAEKIAALEAEVARLRAYTNLQAETYAKLHSGYKEAKSLALLAEVHNEAAKKLAERVETFLECWGKSEETPVTLKRLRDALAEYQAALEGE